MLFYEKAGYSMAKNYAENYCTFLKKTVFLLTLLKRNDEARNNFNDPTVICPCVFSENAYIFSIRVEEI